MDDSTRVRRRPRRAWPATARTAAAIIATASLVLLAAACGGGSSSTGGSRYSQQLAFSRCMRSHGVTNFPDPDGSGRKPDLASLGIDPNSPQFQAAGQACRNYQSGSSGPTQAEVQQRREQALRLSQCMRNHGVPNFPDPDSNGRIPDPTPLGIDLHSPQFQAAYQACRNYAPGPSGHGS